ncbi:MAG: L-rhamnose mutarotase, partial [Candidatus Aminicenantes bacterium]|nr:L-rhamnose mutarotase [Candidatus Aminicenantes bacterium]
MKGDHMIMETVQKRYGSLIKVKPEYEERYIILHKHTFPEVLKQIHDSNIRNYSIYLRDGVLFSYFEYVGEDFDKDMEYMGQNEVTRDWWKL